MEEVGLTEHTVKSCWRPSSVERALRHWHDARADTPLVNRDDLGRSSWAESTHRHTLIFFHHSSLTQHRRAQRRPERNPSTDNSSSSRSYRSLHLCLSSHKGGCLTRKVKQCL